MTASLDYTKVRATRAASFCLRSSRVVMQMLKYTHTMPYPGHHTYNLPVFDMVSYQYC